MPVAGPVMDFPWYGKKRRLRRASISVHTHWFESPCVKNGNSDLLVR